MIREVQTKIKRKGASHDLIFISLWLVSHNQISFFFFHFVPLSVHASRYSRYQTYTAYPLIHTFSTTHLIHPTIRLKHSHFCASLPHFDLQFFLITPLHQKTNRKWSQDKLISLITAHRVPLYSSAPQHQHHHRQHQKAHPR